MCGLFAYAGRVNAVPVLIDGLHSVEYRGYDSAGISVITRSGNIETQKRGDHKASLDNLHKAVIEDQLFGFVGIGHTRWATHGVVNRANSHPHSSVDGLISIAHNGIIENFLEIKDKLIDSGVTFSSETDSEVIAHLAGTYLAKGHSLRDSVVKAVSHIKGNTVVIAIAASEPEKVVGLRLGNAGGIVVGKTNDTAVMASDTVALVPHTEEVIYLESGEVVEIECGSIRLFDFNGASIGRKAVKVNQNFQAAQKGTHPDFMSKEIAEQPEAVQRALAGRVNLVTGGLEMPEIPLTANQIRSINRVIVTGMGTSLHAGMFGASMIESLARIPASAENSSELRYRNPAIDTNTLVIAVTQSGETADTLAAMEYASERGSALGAVLEQESSQAARIADFALPINAGQEIGVASTKTMIASMTTLLELAVFLSKSRGIIDFNRVRQVVDQLAELPSLVASTIGRNTEISSVAEYLAKFTDLLYLGRGPQLSIALEGALKMKELAYIHAEGYPAGEMKHGVNALLGADMPTVVCAPHNYLYDKMLSNISEVKARGGEVIAIVSEGDDMAERVVDKVIHIPNCSELLQPFLTLVPMQLLAYGTAVALGRDPDQPRNLAKTVTVE